MLQNTYLEDEKMAECDICKKELNIEFFYYEHKGKYYCKKHYIEVTERDKKKQKKEGHIKDANKAILEAYNKKPRKFIIDLIKDWKPRNCKKETDYTNSLKEFLDKELPPVDIYVGKESGLEHSRLDLVVSKKKTSTGVYRDFAIELKYNLHKSIDFDSLKGQIHTYVSAKFKHIIILLIGKTTAELETELNNYNKEILNHYSSPLRYSNLSLDTIDVIKKK